MCFKISYSKNIANRIADRIPKGSEVRLKSSLETAENEPKNGGFDKEITKEIYISPEERQQIINNLRFI